ncbi:addiction module antidote protein [Desulfovibrio sp. JC022]|uniref:addiction module antidote protein n=1 Tax=Desulfovibrio sp. JC022 TaxID=2593642 RepID=UPI0013D7ABFB|nr:addiction module antidote protein [Desulfovibrio sp. JC022]NDV21688.1 putative addiction module antidote protein [Desulfovibrio sp. JC022]
MSNIMIEEFDAADFLDNEEVIAEYLNEAIESGDPDLFISVLADIAKARSISEIAKKTNLSRTSLYKALAPGKQPRFSTIFKIVNALGISLHALAPVSKDLHTDLEEQTNIEHNQSEIMHWSRIETKKEHFDFQCLDLFISAKNSITTQQSETIENEPIYIYAKEKIDPKKHTQGINLNVYAKKVDTLYNFDSEYNKHCLNTQH